MKKYFKLSIICVIVLFFTVGIQSDDKELFEIDTANLISIVKPNIMILGDTSGSMNTIIAHPDYDPFVNYTGTVSDSGSMTEINEPRYDSHIYPDTAWEEDGTDYDGPIWMGRWVNVTRTDGYNYTDYVYIRSMPDANTLRVRTGQLRDLKVGDWVIAYYGSGYGLVQAINSVSSLYSDIVVSDVGGFFESGSYILWNDDQQSSNYTFTPIRLYGCDDREKGANLIDSDTSSDLYVRYDYNYLQWLFFHTTQDQRDEVSHFSMYQSWDTDEKPEVEGTDCDAPGQIERQKKRLFTRIQVAREVLCRVGRDSRYIGNIGLFKLNGVDGGELIDGLRDRSEENSMVDFKTDVYKMVAESWTPLAEALADIWRYYKLPGGLSTNNDYWPVDEVYAIPTAYPIKYYCQMNFVVIMTDGESTQDGFEEVVDNQHDSYSGSIFRTYGAQRSENWDGWEDGWGDRDVDSNGDPEPHDPRPLNYDGNDPDVYCPFYSCWTSNGSDYLDDVAYFIYNQDLFPDDLYPDWPGNQNLITYTIGFNIENDLLQHAASNGTGEFYSANNYDELVDAFQKVFLSIKLRSYAFSSITAPVKSSYGSTDDKATVSYIGYFLPQNRKDTNPFGDDPTEDDPDSLWQGHIAAYQLEEYFFFDADNDNEWDDGEPREDIDPLAEDRYVEKTRAEEACEQSGTRVCQMGVNLKSEFMWDAGLRLQNRVDDRDLYTTEPKTTDSALGNFVFGSSDLKDFTLSNASLLEPHFGADDQQEAEDIITMLSYKRLADVFHSDVAFVGPPSVALKYVPNIDDGAATEYKDFYESMRDRQSLLFAGSNDGIFHMFRASGTETTAGEEIWGLLPDEILPKLKQIALGDVNGIAEHEYTVDGRIASGSAYLTGDSRWATLVVFGLRSGGNAYYALDATEDIDGVGSPTPNLLWKFKHDDYSGLSWGLPTIGKIDINDQWVVVLTGGFQYNNENENDKRGKGIFIVDAETGELVWGLGFDKDSAEGIASDGLMSFSEGDTIWTTKHPYFNFSIPSSITTYDGDGDGYLDTIYFGNTGGHMFRADISDRNMNNWKVYHLYACHDSYPVQAQDTIDTITNTIEFQLDSNSADSFDVGSYVITTTGGHYACGRVVTNTLANDTITVETLEGTFMVGDLIQQKDYEPIFLAPAVATDLCDQPWVTFGTGDRDRPLSNKSTGRYVAIRDVLDERQKDVQDLYSDGFNVDNETNRGWYFTFQSTGEKVFDPEPIILPDEDWNPVIYFNTYTPTTEISSTDDVCDIGEGRMQIYIIKFADCADEDADVSVDSEEGRIAGGGMHEGGYVLYVDKNSDVAGVPGADGGTGNFGGKFNEFKNLAGMVFFLNLQ